MPLYDYRCPQGHYFERMAPMAGGERQDCPACGTVALSSTSVPSPSGRSDQHTRPTVRRPTRASRSWS